MKKRIFILLLLVFGCMVPKNAFALDFNSSADYCTYHNGSTVTCGKTNLVKFPNAGNNTGWSAVNTKVSNFDVNSNSFVRLEHTNAQYLCNDKNFGGNVIFYIWFNRPYAKHFVTSNFDYGGNSSFFTCTSWELANGYGLAYSCDFNGSINGSSLGLNLRYVNAGGDVDVSNSLTVGWGTYIGDDVYTCNVDIAGSINTSINSSTNTIINNNNSNTEKILNSNKEAENTRKGILATIKDVLKSITDLPGKLVNLIIDGLKSLFIPSDDYFKDKFNGLYDTLTDFLGFLAYPFTFIVKTVNYLLTVEDSGSYVISWDNVPVPNFEDFNIIKSGSYDFGQLLNNPKVANLRNIAFVFINALLLLAFIQLCTNKYNKIFGDGETSDYEYISTAEEFFFDNEGELTGSRSVNKTTRRRKT